MFTEIINRPAQKRQARACLKTAQVSATTFTLVYLALQLVLSIVSTVADGPTGEPNLLGIFAGVLTGLLGIILQAGFVLYCMAVRKGERAEYATLFDGFAMAGKVIALSILIFSFIFLWSMLFIIPGFIAAYRYRFALYNLYENPDLSPFEALNMSKRQTLGYKYQLFVFDLSYLGWALLASLPTTFFTLQQAQAVMVNGLDPNTLMTLASGSMLISILSTVWMLVIQLFYMPQMICAELGYFAAAKRTSGIGVDNGPSDFDPPTIQASRPNMSGPDNL